MKKTIMLYVFYTENLEKGKHIYHIYWQVNLNALFVKHLIQQTLVINLANYTLLFNRKKRTH